jgi:hypothetical protein
VRTALVGEASDRSRRTGDLRGAIIRAPKSAAITASSNWRIGPRRPRRSCRHPAPASTGPAAASPSGWRSGWAKTCPPWSASTTAFRFPWRISRPTACRTTGLPSSKTSTTIGRPMATTRPWRRSAKVTWDWGRSAPATPAGDASRKSVLGRPSRSSTSTCKARSPSPPTLACLGCSISVANSAGESTSGPSTAGRYRQNARR